MSALEILGIAASLSLLAGWRLYATVLAVGLALRFDWWQLPAQLTNLSVVSHTWVLAVAAVGFVCEFFADKIAWLDSVWDTVHTLIRPLGGALLTLAIVDPSDPATQAIAFILGGGGALLAHGGKAGARAVVNTSPEPVSNVVVSSAEDIATGGLLYLVYSHPLTAGIVALVLGLLAIALLLMALKVLGKLFGKAGPATPE